MTQRTSIGLGLLLILLLSPALSGAGCSAHYWGNLEGTVTLAPDVHQAHQGGKLRLSYRAVNDPGDTCQGDWAACVARAKEWTPLVPCGGSKNKVPVEIPIGDSAAAPFNACTRIVGVTYLADVVAYIDVNGNGALDAGEPWGVFKDGPVARNVKEKSVLVSVSNR